MSASVTPTPASSALPWWKEPTKDQWQAYIAAWLGWTLDAFDFTIFLLIMVPIAESFHVPLIEVTAVFTVTLWLRLVGAVGSGWLADRRAFHGRIRRRQRNHEAGAPHLPRRESGQVQGDAHRAHAL